MYQFRLEAIALNDDTTKINPGALTVLIGPNNSGKSQALKDIVEMTTKSERQRLPPVVVKDLRFSIPASLDALLEAHPEFERKRDTNGNWAYHGLKPTLDGDHPLASGQWRPDFERMFGSRETLLSNGWFSQEFGPGLVGFVTTDNRLQLVKEAPSGVPSTVPNLLKALYLIDDPDKRAKVGEDVASAFDGQSVKLDITDLSVLRLRVARDFGSVPVDPSDARPFMEKERRLDDQGDGIRSFTGIVVALTVLNRPLILIDEPEAFLGPPQARAIGKFIASKASPERQIVVATHSTDVLRGLLMETQNVQILRIDRVGDTNSFCELTSDMLKTISDSPLMNSARVLDALFYETTIVGEGDRDCRFYEAAMQKLATEKQYHFVNAIGKQTVAKIMAVYDQTGVRRAGIVDFDILRDSKEWKAALKEIGFTDGEIDRLSELREAIGKFAKEQPAEERIKEIRPVVDDVVERIEAFENAAFEDDDHHEGKKKRDAAEALERKLRGLLMEARPATDRWRELKREGRNVLDRDRKKAFDQLSSLSAERGLFIVPTGALESLMGEHGVPNTDRKKRAWLEKALSRISELTVDPKKQPWSFLDRVSTHLSRKTKRSV